MPNQFRTDQERAIALTPTEQKNILTIDPGFDSIIKSAYFDNYDLPCPIKVELLTKDGENKVVVLRKTRHGKVQNEVRILRALNEFGLPVPEVILDPFENEQGERAAVYSLLPGENLQKLSMRGEQSLVQAKDLLIQAVLKLREATGFIKNHVVAEIISEQTLAAEFESVTSRSNPWINNEMFQSSIKEIEIRLQLIQTPLILSNGDYQPGNFLAQDGKITGFLDFESVSFQDPLMGFVKYPIYDLRPLSRTDLIDNFLNVSGFSKYDFNTRLALGCLKVLQNEIPVSGGDAETESYRQRTLDLLSQSLST